MLRARSQASVADKGRALHVAVRQDRHVLSNPDRPFFSVDDDARFDPGSLPDMDRLRSKQVCPGRDLTV